MQWLIENFSLQPSKNIFFILRNENIVFRFTLFLVGIFSLLLSIAYCLLAACYPHYTKTQFFISNIANNALEHTMHVVSSWDLLRMWSSWDYKFRLPPKIAKAKARDDEASEREKLIICWMLLALIDMKNDELNTQRTTIDLLCSTKSSKYVC